MGLMRLVAVLVLSATAVACGGSGRDLVIPNPGEPAFAPTHFDDTSDVVTNPYCPIVVGRVLAYEARDSDERVVVEATGSQRTIAGVRCAEVLEQTYEDGELVEETRTWFAQDAAGNVWVLAEAQAELSGGTVVSTAGSWDAEADGITPSIRMKANHVPGDTYRLSAAPDDAADWIRITAADLDMHLPTGGTSYSGCVSLQEWDPTEFGSDELKYYAPGIGLVLEHELDGSDPIELVGMSSR